MIDAELVMRSGVGSDPNLDASEAGVVSLTPSATNGSAVIDISKLGFRPIPISVLVPAGATSTNKTASHAFVIVMQVSDTLDANWEDLVVMHNKIPDPPVGYFAGDGDNALGKHTVWVSTQRKFMRHKATLTGTCNLKATAIYVDVGEMATQ
jgi:hypothetical protein